MKKRVTVIIAALLLFSLAILPAVTASELQETFLQMGFSVPKSELASIDFALENLDGVTEHLEDYRGKVVFLNFWATWCSPCRIEMPSMQSLYDTYKDQGLEIVAVNQGERKSTVESFIEENDYSFNVLLDGNQMVGSIYGVRGIPTTFIIDRNGNILSMLVGTREWNTSQMYELFDDLMDF